MMALRHERAFPLTVVIVFLIAICGAGTGATAAYDSLAHDTAVLADIYSSLRGRGTWPQTWREHWSENAEANTSTPCQDHREWAGATCQHAIKRIVRLSHRSGVATGALPATLGTMTAVMIVDFSENAVTGAVPPFGVHNTALQCVAMSGNQLTGSIPASLGAAPALRFVALGRNKLSGPIPEALGDAGHLEALLLDGNDLSGPVPWSALFRLKQLRHLRLDGNPRLTGAVSGKAIMDAFPQLLALELAGSSGITLQWDDDRLSDLHLLTLPSDTYAPDATRFRGLSTSVHVSSSKPPVYVPRGDVDAPLRFMAMGDFGTGGHMMAAGRELASAFQFPKIAQWVDSQFTITVGDNLYVVPWIPEEAYWVESFEKLYTTPELQRPWYGAIGNHDKYSQTAYAQRSKRWKMASTEYAVSQPIGASSAAAASPPVLDIFVHDSISSHAKPGGYAYNLLRAELMNSSARFKVSTSHYPPISSGCHQSKKTGRAWGGLAAAMNVSAIFAGHDHHSEALFDPSTGMFHFLVGAFSRGACAPHHHAASVFGERMMDGFAYVAVSDQLMNVTYVSDIGHIQFKASVPFDWRVKNMKRVPTAAEIREYARVQQQTPAGSPHTRGEANGPDRANLRTRRPGEKKSTQAAVSPDVPSASMTEAPRAEQSMGTPLPSSAKPLAGVRVSGYAGHQLRPLTALQRDGGPLWWITAVVTVATPFLALVAVLVDRWRSCGTSTPPELSEPAVEKQRSDAHV
jgi:hypothetical protein